MSRPGVQPGPVSGSGPGGWNIKGAGVQFLHVLPGALLLSKLSSPEVTYQPPTTLVACPPPSQ